MTNSTARLSLTQLEQDEALVTNNTVQDEVDILELSIHELRLKCEQINSVHDQLRVRVLAMLTIVVALATYTFANLNIKSMSSSELFLLGFGSVLLAGVFAVMLRLVSTGEWEMAVELKEIERAYDIYGNKLVYLRYIQQDYLTAVRGNNARVGRNGHLFNISLYVLVLSAIILLALKR